MPQPDERGEQERVRSGLTGTVIKGVAVSGGGHALSQALTLGFYLALARLATPEDFGIYAAASVVLGIGYVFTDSGMLAALIHRRDRIEEAANTALISTLLAGLCLSIIALAVAPLAAAVFRDARVGEVTAAASGLLLLKTCTVTPDALLQRRFSFLRRTITEPVAVIVFGVTAVIGTSQGLGVWGLVIGHYAGATVDAVLTFGLARWRPRPWLASFEMWRELISYGRHIITAGLVLRSGDQADRVIVGRAIGTAALGQYSYAFRLASTPQVAMLSAASYVLFPAFARIVDDRERFVPAFLRALRWVSVAAFPAGLILVPLGEPLAVLLFGQVWREAGYAAMAMCMFASANAVASIPLEAIKAEGSPELLTRVFAVTTIVTVFIMLAMLPLGLTGVAGALSIGTVIGAVYTFHVFRGVIAIPVGAIVHEIWPPAAAALVMAAAVTPLEHLAVLADQQGIAIGLLLVGAEALFGAVVFLGALKVFAPRTTAALFQGAKGIWLRFGQRPRHRQRASDL